MNNCNKNCDIDNLKLKFEDYFANVATKKEITKPFSKKNNAAAKNKL